MTNRGGAVPVIAPMGDVFCVNRLVAVAALDYSTPPRLRNGRRTVLLRLRNSRLRNSRALETDKLAYTHTIKYAANLNNIETTGSLTVVWDCLCSALRQACFVVRISCHLT